MHCRMVSGIPGCYLPDASSTPTLTLCQPEMSPNIEKYLLGSNCFLSPTKNQSDLKKPKNQKTMILLYLLYYIIFFQNHLRINCRYTGGSHPYIFKILIVFFYLFLYKLSFQHGAQTHNHKIKSPMLY